MNKKHCSVTILRGYEICYRTFVITQGILNAVSMIYGLVNKVGWEEF